eukprot:CAMPEP_0119139132 /NCGR_PEP_ID=MMETSP1310-20130426/26956_1 /TAXON_ID=464262 /ORGANISM="Genus nov. species nov., Strain RCC2339" /LENGTH=315 /DNA_ID=CAMNT_0007130393 /DNA_START=75 /DNA_END=1019 /DNA_ORIENTATION=+
METKTVPKFKLEGSVFDMKTYQGRYQHFMDFIHPKYLLCSSQELQHARNLIRAYKRNPASVNATDKELWDAQSKSQASFAADGTLIPVPFRMYGFIPFNVIVVAGMCNPQLSLPTVVFWHWFNQTHNAAINYYNRPSVKPAPLIEILKPYSLAVTGAMGVVLGAPKLIPKISKSPSVQSVLRGIVPFTAVAFANVLNVGFMRSDELFNGIPVTTAEGEVVGTSVEAAKKALAETAISRVTLSAPLLIIPSFLLPIVQRTSLMKRYPRLDLPFQMVLATSIFYTALPNMLAFYPQINEISKDDLEEEFSNRTEKLF